MASMPRLHRLRTLCLLAALPAGAQVPLPPAAQVLKPLAGKVVDAILKPKMKVDHFTVGGFTVKDVDPTSEATPEKFEGEGLLEMPAPGHPTKVTFKNLVLKGTAAEGTVEADFPAGHHAKVHGWTYRLKKVVVSDKGSHLEGTAEVAGIRLQVGTLAFTPAGLQGTLSPGDLPLAEGVFDAVLQKAEVAFAGAAAPQLKGTVKVTLAAPVRHALTGAAIELEVAGVAFDSGLLSEESAGGTVVPTLATNLLLLHQGRTWRMDQVAFGFEHGRPQLWGPTRLQFPLNVFCQVGATGEPYLTGAVSKQLQARIPTPESNPVARGVQRTVFKVLEPFEGFSGAFPLPPAQLHPYGLTAYRLQVEGGTAGLTKGVVDPAKTRLTGKLTFGADFKQEVAFTDAEAALSDGLYVAKGSWTTVAPVGGCYVAPFLARAACDFSPSHSPEGLDAGWQGVYLPIYFLGLPEALYTLGSDGHHYPVRATGKGGRFEANGAFSGDVAVPEIPLSSGVLLHIAPVALSAFELHFVDGVLIQGPTVTGVLKPNADQVLQIKEGDALPALSFHLTQNGVEQVELDMGPEGKPFESGLIGVYTTVERGVLNPSNLDLSGRFDFHLEGAALPSIPFEHMVLEAVEGKGDELGLTMAGAKWDAQPDQPRVDLWGFGFGLAERGFGVDKDRRFFVGFGGDMDINPLLPSLYNRLVFTTAPSPSDASKDIAVVKLEESFHLDQAMSGLGSLKADMGFTVETKDKAVSTAYFLGTGSLDLAMGKDGMNIDAGVRFGRAMTGGGSYPYFYALGHVQFPKGGIQVVPDVEIYGGTGGLAQNFKPGKITDPLTIEGEPDASQGYGVIAGVDLGSTDHYTFHGALDLYISQNLTTLLQGEAWLFCSRESTSADNHVSANISFTRNPNVFDASFAADIQQSNGMLRYMGTVAMHFGPDRKFVHIGSPDAPVKAVFSGIAEGTGYLMADVEGDHAALAAGAGFSWDSGDRDFGPLYGRAWVNAHGDLIIALDNGNPSFRGVLAAEGGAEFGMAFHTPWKTYHLTVFSGSLSTAMAFQAPGSPKLSGKVTIHYRVLGGAFEGNATAHLDIP